MENKIELFHWYKNPFNCKKIAVLAKKGDFLYYYEQNDNKTLKTIGCNTLSLYEKGNIINKKDLVFFMESLSFNKDIFNENLIKKQYLKIKITNL